ncbi:hypothetical protein LINPERHAP1_LOCUS31269 [Linum perenne]
MRLITLDAPRLLSRTRRLRASINRGRRRL